jgi:hypothetical protein
MESLAIFGDQHTCEYTEEPTATHPKKTVLDQPSQCARFLAVEHYDQSYLVGCHVVRYLQQLINFSIEN